jgi:hypothetical protein
VSVWVTIAIVVLGGAVVWMNRALFHFAGDEARWTQDRLRGSGYWSEHGNVLEDQIFKIHARQLDKPFEPWSKIGKTLYAPNPKQP